MAIDTVSLARLNQLHPAIRQDATSAYNEAVKKTPKNVHPVIIQTYRSFEEQDLLYQKGRTRPGAKVTNARAGASFHNYGLAADFCLQVNGKLKWVVDKNWMIVIDCFKKKGFKSGLDWKTFKDAPHVEKVFSLSWRELLKRHNEGKVDSDGYVNIES